MFFSNQVSKKYVSKELAKEIHAKAAPFVKWLKEAEEESEGSEEEEEEDDENVEVTRCSTGSGFLKLMKNGINKQDRSQNNVLYK